MHMSEFSFETLFFQAHCSVSFFLDESDFVFTKDIRECTHCLWIARRGGVNCLEGVTVTPNTPDNSKMWADISISVEKTTHFFKKRLRSSLSRVSPEKVKMQTQKLRI